MEVHTARFGTLEVSEDEIIRFPQGILGFEGIERYVLVPHKEGSPFAFLQAMDDPNLTFIVTDPTGFWPTYQVEVFPDDVEAIELEETDEVALFAIVNVPGDVSQMTANLLAPLVVNTRNRLAKQVVQRDSVYTVRHKVADALQALEDAGGDGGGDNDEGAADGDKAERPPRLVKVG